MDTLNDTKHGHLNEIIVKKNKITKNSHKHCFENQKLRKKHIKITFKCYINYHSYFQHATLIKKQTSRQK